MKEEIFSKFRDYNNELEKILEKKDFSKDSKNLLLSMFYKVENSYSDYETVKRNIKSKQEYLENILSNIKLCNSIELVKPNTNQFREFKEKNLVYNVDLKMKKIKVIDNELYLLAAIFELNDFKIYLDERYNLIRNAFPYLLNSANDMSNTEVLRDFNAFSWNTNVEEISNIPINLIYENLKIALSFDIINKLETTNENMDYINLIKNDLCFQYGEEIANAFLDLIFELSILIYVEKSESEKKRILYEKNVIEDELSKIKDKKNYIESVIKEKINFTDRVKEIDFILNDKELLMKEYKKRNQTASNYKKIFNLSHLSEKLQKERNNLLIQIDEDNRKLEPNRYLQDKQKLQNDYNILKSIKENTNFEKTIYKKISKLQIMFLKDILPKKIDFLNTKEEILDFVYKVRYYELTPYTDQNEINEIIELNEFNSNALKKIIKKMYDMKIIHTMSTNEQQDINIVKNIFFTRIIDLEQIYLELRKIEENKYALKVYDGKDTLDKNIDITLNFNKKDRKKLKRKVKLF